MQRDSGSVAPETRLNFALRNKSRPTPPTPTPRPGSRAKAQVRLSRAQDAVGGALVLTHGLGGSFRTHQAGSRVPDTLVPAGAEGNTSGVGPSSMLLQHETN